MVSERELLLQWGYQEHHFVELPDKSILLNEEAILRDYQMNRFKKLLLLTQTSNNLAE